jgi:hypothetical protein
MAAKRVGDGVQKALKDGLVTRADHRTHIRIVEHLPELSTQVLQPHQELGDLNPEAWKPLHHPLPW